VKFKEWKRKRGGDFERISSQLRWRREGGKKKKGPKRGPRSVVPAVRADGKGTKGEGRRKENTV